MSSNVTPELLTDRLRSIPARWAEPDPSTLATLPKGGANLSYMGHAEVTLALIEADPAWTWRPVAFHPDTGGPQVEVQGNRLVMWGYLTVCGVERLCVGTCEARKGDPEKELIGDLLRNGAMRFGIGTKLWSKATDADPAGSGAGGFQRGGKPARDGSGKDTTSAQLKKLAATFTDAGISERDERLAFASNVVGRELSSSKDLTTAEASRVIDALGELIDFNAGTEDGAA